MSNLEKNRENGSHERMPLTRKNYLMMLAGGVIIVIGFLLMSGGGNHTTDRKSVV